MCGICGQFDPVDGVRVDDARASAAVRSLVHRGPDGRGIAADAHALLGHARLSVIDLEQGAQPMATPDGGLWLTFNGEIFNYRELRSELEARGIRFRTESDTEVLLRLFERDGVAALDRLNGQFAFAAYDRRQRRLWLARDRLGIRPLYYACDGARVAFASEVKALLALGAVAPRLDLEALAQTLTLWAPLPGRSLFEGVQSLPPGHFLAADDRGVRVERWWSFPFPEAPSEADDAELEEEVRTTLDDAVRLRLRSDVPVGAYLSGGLDSTITTALMRRHHTGDLSSFSIGFTDERYDESTFQEEAVQHIGTAHRAFTCSPDDIAGSLRSVVKHVEQPLLRTAPVPLFQLSRCVRDAPYKVVLTGEGADEMFLGYNLFKENRIRRFWARQPESALRPRLFERIYGYVDGGERAGSFWQGFFGRGLADTDDPLYSHRIRWGNSRFALNFLSPEARGALGDYDAELDARDRLAAELQRLDATQRAQALEVGVFLSGYLLSAQGDRVAMAHSVEGRYPFLDPRVIELAARLPRRMKLFGLDEKRVLKRAFRAVLPERIAQRAKQPYRAPVRAVLTRVLAAEPELLSPARLGATGVFDPAKVARLAARLADERKAFSEREEMAAMAVVTTQLFAEELIEAPAPPAASEASPLPVVAMGEA